MRTYTEDEFVGSNVPTRGSKLVPYTRPRRYHRHTRAGLTQTTRTQPYRSYMGTIKSIVLRGFFSAFIMFCFMHADTILPIAVTLYKIVCFTALVVDKALMQALSVVGSHILDKLDHYDY
ncbi:hypothetical protein FRC06_004182 [Ceratobasidium sp. 370]|nr:hypothetical protein FRC06_004182 [Ceratobasidium sp. 370]